MAGNFARAQGPVCPQRRPALRRRDVRRGTGQSPDSQFGLPGHRSLSPVRMITEGLFTGRLRSRRRSGIICSAGAGSARRAGARAAVRVRAEYGKSRWTVRAAVVGEWPMVEVATRRGRRKARERLAAADRVRGDGLAGVRRRVSAGWRGAVARHAAAPRRRPCLFLRPRRLPGSGCPSDLARLADPGHRGHQR